MPRNPRRTRKPVAKPVRPRVRIRQLLLPFEPLTPEIIARKHTGIIFNTILPREEFFQRYGIGVDDLIQNAFVHLTHVASQYDPNRGSQSTFITHVVTNYLNNLQKQLRRNKKPLELDGKPSVQFSLDRRTARLWKQHKNDWLDTRENRLRINWITHSIPQLSPKSQYVARLFLEGKNLREIGFELLNSDAINTRAPISYNNTKMTGHRAFTKLVKELTRLLQKQRHPKK